MDPLSGAIIMITILLVELGQAVNRWLQNRKVRNANRRKNAER